MLDRLTALVVLILLGLGLLAVLGDKFGGRPGFLGRLTGGISSWLRARSWSPRVWGLQAIYLMALVGQPLYQNHVTIGSAALPTTVWIVATLVATIVLLGPVRPTPLSSTLVHGKMQKVYLVSQFAVLLFLLAATW